MKTWLTYLAAAAMGLAFELTFRDSLFFVSSMNFMADVVMKLGAFIVFPLAFFTMASGTALRYNTALLDGRHYLLR